MSIDYNSFVGSDTLSIIMFTVIAVKVKILTYTPTLPISLAIVSNFNYKGVASSSMLSFSSACPDLV